MRVRGYADVVLDRTTAPRSRILLHLTERTKRENAPGRAR